MTRILDGIREEIMEQFGIDTSGIHFSQQLDRLTEVSNHGTLPECSQCPTSEICLEKGPSCPEARKTVIKSQL